jgi:hypothetical protein
MPIGDLSARETELGVTTPEMVEQRARDRATQRTQPRSIYRCGLEQARAELAGTQGGLPDDPIERGSLPRVLPKDEALLDERLASRGVEEAAHDQMVEAAKSDQKQEG